MKKIAVAVAVIPSMDYGIYDFVDDFVAAIEKTLTAD